MTEDISWQNWRQFISLFSYVKPCVSNNNLFISKDRWDKKLNIFPRYWENKADCLIVLLIDNQDYWTVP